MEYHVPSAEEILTKIQKSTEYIRSKLPADAQIEVGIVCGSGLGGLADTLENITSINYTDIPHFSKSTVKGHVSKLVYGTLSGKSTLCMVGRFHYYEGHSLPQVVYPIRVMASLGVKNLIVTNAAGGLNPDFQIGDVMVIEDHISFPNLSGNHCLIGPNLENFGPRFPSTSDAYDLELRRLAFASAKELPTEKGTLTLREGIYANVSGPSYETRTESRFLRMVGADVVGMSTIPEVIAAKHCGLKILGLSLVTNKVLTARQPPSYAPPPVNSEKEVHATHEEVLAASAAKALLLQDLVRHIVSNI